MKNSDTVEFKSKKIKLGVDVEFFGKRKDASSRLEGPLYLSLESCL
jgi:hypothetical protein